MLKFSNANVGGESDRVRTCAETGSEDPNDETRNISIIPSCIEENQYFSYMHKKIN